MSTEIDKMPLTQENLSKPKQLSYNQTMLAVVFFKCQDLVKYSISPLKLVYFVTARVMPKKISPQHVLL